MYQPWIFGTVMATGAGLVALTVSLQRPPTLATAERFEFDAVRVVPPPLPPTVEAPQAPSPTLELEPVVIHGRTRQAVAAPAPPPVPDKLAERPCSTWRELGPTHVVAGTPTGDLSVRQLCE
jgi:hypothetical protein